MVFKQNIAEMFHLYAIDSISKLELFKRFKDVGVRHLQTLIEKLDREIHQNIIRLKSTPILL